MVQKDVESVSAYIAAQPQAARAHLKRLRTIIRKAVPGAQEVVSYKIPTYKVAGRAVIYFAGWKTHYALYPAGARVVAAFKDELASYEVKGSTIRFPLAEPIPARLIARIAKCMLKDAAERRKTKAAAPKKR